MEANLLPCNAAVRLQARTNFSSFCLENKAEVNYGQNHCVLRAQSLPEKDIEVDLGGTKREGHRVQLSKKEVGLSGKAIGLSQALFHP